jgi:uncharacterized Tic20 family protein
VTTPEPWSLSPKTMTAEQERTWAMLGHFSMIPLGFLGPLFFWVAGKDRSPFADDQGKEALNFAIGINIGFAVSTVLLFLAFFNPWFALAGAVGWLIFGLGGVILPFRAGIAAYHGEVYRYPLAVRFID